MNTLLPEVPFLDVAAAGPVAHARARRPQTLAVRSACLGWLPGGTALARVGDPLVRKWMSRSGTPYAADIAVIQRDLGHPGVWTLHAAYLFGCTALADEGSSGPRLRRTLDWPFPGLGRLVELVRQQGPAGDFINVTWPGFVGVLTATAKGRFAASINQAPMPWRGREGVGLWSDYARNALAAWRDGEGLLPEHLLRLVIERECRAARSRGVDTVVANAWSEDRAEWRPRVCGEGSPGPNNRARVSALSGWAGREGTDFAWAAPPVMNACTRLTVELAPTTGAVVVAGWEPDGRGGVAPATATTRYAS